MTREGSRQPHPVFEAIAASARREILRLLLVRDEQVTEQELVVHLAATQESPASRGPAADRRAIHTTLTHAQLPSLEDAGLIEWDSDDATVDAAPHPAFEDSRFRLLLEAEADGLDEVLSNLANERRRILLTILEGDRGPMTQADLARELLRRETGASDPDPGELDDVLTSLHHDHLPKLARAGLIKYDYERGHARYSRHPALEEVFTIIFEPDERLADSYDAFLGGLETAYDELNEEPVAGWPHAWRNPHHV